MAAAMHEARARDSRGKVGSNVPTDGNNAAQMNDSGYQTARSDAARAVRAPRATGTASRGNLRNLADLPSLGTYWISTLGMMQRHQHPATRNARRGGFTLIEAAIVTAIVGIGIVGLLELLAAGSMANINSKQLTTAVFLANNINEMMQGKDYDELKATYDNVTYGGSVAYPSPKDGRGENLVGFDSWKQIIDVSYVLPQRLTSVVPDTQVEPTSRVTVKIVANDEIIYQTQWIVAAAE
jgi:type II secretory pathway pseudopilin PulG